MGVCESNVERPESSDMPESDKRGDAAAAVRELEAEEKSSPRPRKQPQPSLARQTQGRVIQLCVASRDPDLPASLQGKNILWTTQVEDTNTVGDIIDKQYLCKTSSSCCDEFGDLDNITGVYLHWTIPLDESMDEQSAPRVFDRDAKFSDIFQQFPPPNVGPIRLIGNMASAVGLSHWKHPDSDVFWRKNNETWKELRQMPSGRCPRWSHWWRCVARQ